MKYNSVLLLGRSNCSYTNKIKIFLKKESKKFQYIECKKYGEKLNRKLIKNKSYEYIFSFRSFFIIKSYLLKKCKIAAINFHPGPPEYRGIGCINYALYENAKFYGCTAHIINKEIDRGEIIDLRRFKIKKKDTIESCLKKTHRKSYEQAMFLFKSILKNNDFLRASIQKHKNIKWSKKIKNKKDLDNFYNININSNKTKLLNKIRATYTTKYKPYITLNKNKFYLY